MAKQSRRFRNLQAAREKQRAGESEAVTTQANQGRQPQPPVRVNTSAPAPVASNTTETRPITPTYVTELSAVQRKALDQGPLVKFFLNDQCLIHVRYNLFATASTKAASLVDACHEVDLPSHCSEGSVGHLLSWLNGLPTKNKIFKPRFVRDFAKAVQLYHAAEALGMLKYVDNTVGFHVKAIRNSTPLEHVLSTVEELSQGENDRFLDIVAGRIAYLIRKNDASIDSEYLAFVSTFTKVNEAVRKINATFEKRQEQAESRRQFLEREARRQAKAEALAESHRLFLEREARRQEKEQANCGHWTVKQMMEMMEKRETLLQKLNQKKDPLTSQERKMVHFFKYTKKDPDFAKAA